MFYFIGLFASLALLYKLWPRELDVVSHFYACLTSVMIALSGLRPGTGLGDFDPVQRPAHMAALRKRVFETNETFRSWGMPDVPEVRTDVIVVEGTQCILYKPRAFTGVLPTLVYIHGGGFALGDPRMSTKRFQAMAKELHIAIVSVGYALAPESKFPGPVMECVKVVKWIGSGGGTALGLDGSRIVISGDSAGGGLTAAVGIFIKENKPALLTTIKGLAMWCPWVDMTLSCPTLVQLHSGYVTNLRLLLWCRHQYLSKPEDCVNVLASPLLATVEQLRGLPPSLVFTAEFDPLRDEGEAFAHKLASAGVDTRFTRYPKTIHCFYQYPGIAVGGPAFREFTQWVGQQLRAP